MKTLCELRLSCLPNPPYLATVQFPHKTTRADCIAEFGLLTARRVRYITSSSPWHPGSADYSMRCGTLANWTRSRDSTHQTLSPTPVPTVRVKPEGDI